MYAQLDAFSQSSPESRQAIKNSHLGSIYQLGDLPGRQASFVLAGKHAAIPFAELLNTFAESMVTIVGLSDALHVPVGEFFDQLVTEDKSIVAPLPASAANFEAGDAA